MANTYPVVLALFGVSTATALVLAVASLATAARRRLHARRWRTLDDVVVDLDFLTAAIEWDSELASIRLGDKVLGDAGDPHLARTR